MLFRILFAFSKNDFVAQMRLFVEVLLVQSGRVCLTLTDLQEILKLGGVEASLHGSPTVLSVPILQPCLRSEQLMVSHPFRPLSKLASKQQTMYSCNLKSKLMVRWSLVDSPLSPAMPLKQETLAEGDKTVAALMGEWRAVAHLHSLPWNIAAGLSLTIKLEVSITANYTIQMIHRDL